MVDGVCQSEHVWERQGRIHDAMPLGDPRQRQWWHCKACGLLETRPFEHEWRQTGIAWSGKRAGTVTWECVVCKARATTRAPVPAPCRKQVKC